MKRTIILIFSAFLCFHAFTQTLDSKAEKKTIVLYTEKYTIPDSNIQATKDDYTLFNIVFFSQTQNCGFVYNPGNFLMK